MAQRIERPHQCDLEVAALIAALNWKNWRDCFEAGGKMLPERLLEDSDRFQEFIQEYGLWRYASAENRMRLRRWMTEEDRVGRLIAEKDGSGVDCLVQEMKDNGFTGERSFLSKIAAFARPDVFIAYDRYAKEGLFELGVVQRKPGNYVMYLEAVRKLRCDIGKDIEKHLEGRSLPPKNGAAFQLRVLDVYLMMSGSRKINIKSDKLVDILKCNSPGSRLF